MLSVILHDLEVASKIALDDAWQHVLRSMATIRSVRERIARPPLEDTDPGLMVHASPLASIAAVGQDDRIRGDTRVVSVGELLVLCEAVRILARVRFESPLDLASGDAAGLGCATIHMLLDNFIQNADGMVLAAL